MLGFFIVLFVALGITFLFLFISYRNEALIKQERISEAKSAVRVKKAKYLQVMKKSNQMNTSAAEATRGMYEGIGSILRDSRGNENYGISVDLVAKLATEYENAQLELNTLIKEWNEFISKFPNFIYSSILKHQKEAYVDSERLNMSTSLSDDIDSDEI